MFVHPTNTAVILDLKSISFLINQKLFLSTSEYHYYHQGRKWNMPDFWNRHNHSLSKVYRFILKLPRFLILTCFPRLADLVCFPSGRSLRCLPHFVPTASGIITSSKKVLSALSAIRKITRVNFTRRQTEVNFPSVDWLGYQRTQLTVFVGEVRLRSKQIFSVLFNFSKKIISPEGDTLNSY